MNTTLAYVGSRTTVERNARGAGLSVFRLDDATGGLELLQVCGDLVNPSYLTLHPRGHRLYTVHGDRREISTLAVDPRSGRLTRLHTRTFEGRNPVHLALSPDARHVVVSSHLTGEVLVLPIDAAADDTVGEVVQRVALPGTPGPHRVEQPFSKPHFNPFSPDGRHLFVPDKGLDRIFTFRWQDDRLVPAEVPHVEAREGAGPRGVVCASGTDGQTQLYAANELDSTVTAYRCGPGGQLTPFQCLSSLPDHFTGNSRAAGIALHPSGRVLYVSNRGCDGVTVFDLDQASGRLTFLGAVPVQGRTPRFFTLTPDARFLQVLNEDSDSIVTFAVEADGRRLVPTGAVTPCGSPVCMVFGRTQG
jgi:6-phosphogluconolactonase